MEQLTLIYQKEEILEGLASAFKDVNDFVSQVSNEQFLDKIGSKWSIAENLDHLIRSTKGLGSALKMPKITMRAFGRPNRASRNFQGLVDKYHSKLQNGAVASGPYVPEKNTRFESETMIANWNLIGSKYASRLTSWSEKQLDDYLLPHPLLGKLTIREMMFFTIYHNRHHLKAMNALL